MVNKKQNNNITVREIKLFFIPTPRGGREEAKELRARTERVFTRKLKQHLMPLDADCCSFLTGIRANHNTPSLIHACINISKVV